MSTRPKYIQTIFLCTAVPLHYAARYEKADMLGLCCQYIKDLNPKDKNGKTPVRLAAGVGNLVEMAVLQEKGADIHARDNLTSCSARGTIGFSGVDIGAYDNRCKS